MNALDTAAQLLILGLDPLPFLLTKDAFERQLMVEVARRAQRYLEIVQEAQAMHIAAQVGKLFGG